MKGGRCGSNLTPIKMKLKPPIFIVSRNLPLEVGFQFANSFNGTNIYYGHPAMDIDMDAPFLNSNPDCSSTSVPACRFIC